MQFVNIQRKWLAPVALVALLLLVGLVTVFAIRGAQPSYAPAADGVALGPAAHHTQAGTDVLIQIATGALTTAAGNAGGELPSIGDTTPTPSEQALLDLTNADRATSGLPPVAFDAMSLQVARVRAAAQIPDGPLSHYNSLGELAFVGLLADAGVPYSLAGENLARTSSQDSATVSRLNDALMNSPTHRANILEPAFNQLAVGAATGLDGRLAFAEIFRGLSDQ
jgi:uncharacterized protein YkwD